METENTKFFGAFECPLKADYVYCPLSTLIDLDGNNARQLVLVIWVEYLIIRTLDWHWTNHNFLHNKKQGSEICLETNYFILCRSRANYVALILGIKLMLWMVYQENNNNNKHFNWLTNFFSWIRNFSVIYLVQVTVTLQQIKFTLSTIRLFVLSNTPHVL